MKKVALAVMIATMLFSSCKKEDEVLINDQDTISNTSKGVVHGVLEIHQDTKRNMDWYDASEYCESLGNEWRMPTITELDYLFENSDEIGDFFRDGYWSSREGDIGYAKYKYFKSSATRNKSKYSRMSIRAVRDI